MKVFLPKSRGTTSIPNPTKAMEAATQKKPPKVFAAGDSLGEKAAHKNRTVETTMATLVIRVIMVVLGRGRVPPSRSDSTGFCSCAQAVLPSGRISELTSGSGLGEGSISVDKSTGLLFSGTLKNTYPCSADKLLSRFAFHRVSHLFNRVPQPEQSTVTAICNISLLRPDTFLPPSRVRPIVATVQLNVRARN